MKEFLCRIDALGSITYLRYNGKSSFRSVFGGILTLLLGSLGLIILVFFGLQFISKSDFQELDLEIKNEQYEPIPLNNQLKFALHTLQDNKLALRPDMYNITVRTIRRDFNNNIFEEDQLRLEQCKSENWKEVDKSEFDYFGLDSALCLYTSDLKISTLSYIAKTEYIFFTVSINRNLTSPSMRSYMKNEMKKSLPMVILYYIDTSFNSSKIKNKTDYYINTLPVNLSYTDIRESYLIFARNKLTEVQNFLFGSNEIHHEAFSRMNLRENISVREEDETELCKIYIVRSERFRHKYVNYMKLSDLFSQIGGSLNALYICFNIITTFFNGILSENALHNMILDKLETDEIITKSNNLWDKKNNEIEKSKQKKVTKEIKPPEEANQDIHVKIFKRSSIVKEGLVKEDDSNIRKLNDKCILPNLANYDDFYNIENNKLSASMIEENSNNRLVNSQVRTSFYKLNKNKEIVRNAINSHHIQPRRLFPLPASACFYSDKVPKAHADFSKLEDEKIPLRKRNTIRLNFDEKIIANKTQIHRDKIRLFYKAEGNQQYRFTFCGRICLDFFYPCMCQKKKRKSDKKFLYTIIDYYLSNSLEVSNIMKNNWDIEMIKFLILDSAQYDAYDKIPFLNGLEVMMMFQKEKLRKFHRLNINRFALPPLDEGEEAEIKNLTMDEKLLALTDNRKDDINS